MSSEFVVSSGRHSLEKFLEPLRKLPGVESDSLGEFEVAGEKYSLPRFLFRGPNSSDPICIGIFATIHGDEPVGALACARLLQNLSHSPALAENFSIRVYPICNPTGFEDNTRHSRTGRDLNREFWKASAQLEVRLLEQELRTRRFQGIIQLHADDSSEGIYGFVRGATLTENLLRPALLEAGKILPRNENAQIDGFAARDGIIYDHYEGVLGAPAQLQPAPFEIILETPHRAQMDLQIAALDVAIRTILTDYRRLISFAQDI